jgi:hypothetical protein
VTPPRPQSSFSLHSWLPLGAIGAVLILLFVVNVLAGALPSRLLDPRWQLNLVASLIDNASLALVGLGLIHLQAYHAPYDPLIQKRRDRVARLAVLAVLGFLLLVPLQITASLRLVQAARVDEARRVASITADYNVMRQAILAASSSEDLQLRLQRLQRLPAPLLQPGQPSALEPLRRRLLLSLEKARSDGLRQLASASRPRLWPLLTAAVRNLVCCLALAVGFAAAARNRTSPVPLLSEFNSLLRSETFRPLRRLIRRRPGKVHDADYLSAISPGNRRRRETR